MTFQYCNTRNLKKRQVHTSSKDRLNGDERCINLLRELPNSLVRVLIGVGVDVGLERPRLGEQWQCHWNRQTLSRVDLLHSGQDALYMPLHFPKVSNICHLSDHLTNLSKSSCKVCGSL